MARRRFRRKRTTLGYTKNRMRRVWQVTGKQGMTATITKAQSTFYISCGGLRNYALTYSRALVLAHMMLNRIPFGDPVL